MTYDQIAALTREERLAATFHLWRAYPLRFTPQPVDLKEFHGVYLTEAQRRALREHDEFYGGQRAPLPAGVEGADDAA